jgi:hypothetical protein
VYVKEPMWSSLLPGGHRSVLGRTALAGMYWCLCHYLVPLVIDHNINIYRAGRAGRPLKRDSG